MFTFNSPWVLLLILVVIPLIALRYVLRIPGGSVRFSSLTNLRRLRTSPSLWARHILLPLRCLAVLLLVLALARPQEGREETKVLTEGIDIELLLDYSSSMRAWDMEMNNAKRNRIIEREKDEPSRLYFAKKVIEQFIEGRENDRIGLVRFARYAYTQCPLTLHYGLLRQFLKQIKIAEKDEDGTAIGTAIATAVLRLQEPEGADAASSSPDRAPKSRVIILLTDGRSNFGDVDPANAAEIAKVEGIKIYTIGVGTDERFAPYPGQDFFGNLVLKRMEVDIDEETLKHIAETTGGKYFRATDVSSLAKIYDEIDKLEKTEKEVSTYLEYTEKFSGFVMAALALLLIEVVLASTVFRKIP